MPTPRFLYLAMAAAPRTLTKTELDFIMRAIMDARHVLAVTGGMRITEAEFGEVLTPENSSDSHHLDLIHGLELATRLLGWPDDRTPPPLDRQFGMRALLEATGHDELLDAFETWHAVKRARR